MKASNRPLRVMHIARVYLNPYAHQLTAGINQSSPQVRASVNDGFTLPWIVRRHGRFDILHFHWIEMLYAAPSRWRRHLKLTSVIAGLVWAKLTGVKIIYTVHNLRSHEGQSPRLNRIANRAMFRLADAIHVHNEQARADVKHHCGRTHNVFVIPHGSYIGTYPDTFSRETARRSFNFTNDQFVFIFLGLLRPYKGIERLLTAFEQTGDPRARLILAGHADSAGYKTMVLQAAERDPRLTVFPQYVPDNQLSRFLRAADCSVLPYHCATTSGAALLAFSFSLPIIAPDLGPFPALVEGSRGLLYDPATEGALTKALQAALAGESAGMGQNALAFARERRWDRIGTQHVRMYNVALGWLSATEGSND